VLFPSQAESRDPTTQLALLIRCAIHLVRSFLRASGGFVGYPPVAANCELTVDSNSTTLSCIRLLEWREIARLVLHSYMDLAPSAMNIKLERCADQFPPPPYEATRLHRSEIVRCHLNSIGIIARR
jgi:hypothetical protein